MAPRRKTLVEKIEARIQELEPDIRKMVRHWSWDCPESWEDLAQEARLAIYLQLKQDPETPRSHLMQHAKCAILRYRQRGRSVDGKLNRMARRSHVWKMVSLDADPGIELIDDGSPYFRAHQLTPVEDLVLDKVTYQEMTRRLSEQQAQYLALKLQGYASRQIVAMMGMTQWGGHRLREEIKRQARDILQEAAPCTP